MILPLRPRKCEPLRVSSYDEMVVVTSAGNRLSKNSVCCDTSTRLSSRKRVVSEASTSGGTYVKAGRWVLPVIP
jgi:hypothetical protein